MGGHVAVVALRLVDDRLHLFLRELDVVDAVARGGNASGSAYLYELGAGAELLPHAEDAVVDAVHEPVGMTVGVGELFGQVEGRVHVAARYPEQFAARQDARPLKHASLDGAGEVEAGLAHLPQPREARLEEEPHLVGGAEKLVPEELGASGVLLPREVGVAVDEAGQDGTASDVHNLGFRGDVEAKLGADIVDRLPEAHETFFKGLFRNAVYDPSL